MESVLEKVTETNLLSVSMATSAVWSTFFAHKRQIQTLVFSQIKKPIEDQILAERSIITYNRGKINSKERKMTKRKSKDEMIDIYWQGDIVFVPVDGLPKEEKTEVKDRILARGEITGHTHAVRQGAEAMVYMMGTQMYLHALRPVEIDHQEHGTITLPIGYFKIQRQAEYTPRGLRTVAD